MMMMMMMICVVLVGECSQVMLLCGSVEDRISKELVQLEVATEENVLKPLTTILDDDIPAIDKLRRQLDTRTLDMDAAKNRSVSDFIQQKNLLFYDCFLSY